MDPRYPNFVPRNFSSHLGIDGVMGEFARFFNPIIGNSLPSLEGYGPFPVLTSMQPY